MSGKLQSTDSNAQFIELKKRIKDPAYLQALREGSDQLAPDLQQALEKYPNYTDAHGKHAPGLDGLNALAAKADAIDAARAAAPTPNPNGPKKPESKSDPAPEKPTADNLAQRVAKLRGQADNFLSPLKGIIPFTRATTTGFHDEDYKQNLAALREQIEAARKNKNPEELEALEAQVKDREGLGKMLEGQHETLASFQRSVSQNRSKQPGPTMAAVVTGADGVTRFLSTKGTSGGNTLIGHYQLENKYFEHALGEMNKNADALKSYGVKEGHKLLVVKVGDEKVLRAVPDNIHAELMKKSKGKNMMSVSDINDALADKGLMSVADLKDLTAAKGQCTKFKATQGGKQSSINLVHDITVKAAQHLVPKDRLHAKQVGPAGATPEESVTVGSGNEEKAPDQAGGKKGLDGAKPIKVVSPGSDAANDADQSEEKARPGETAPMAATGTDPALINSTTTGAGGRPPALKVPEGSDGLDTPSTVSGPGSGSGGMPTGSPLDSSRGSEHDGDATPSAPASP